MDAKIDAIGGVYEDFWTGRNDRGLMHISYGRAEIRAEKAVRPWMPPERGWTMAVGLEKFLATADEKFIAEALDYVEAECAGTGYAAEGFPGWWFNLGPGVVAAFLTGFSRFVDHSVWFELDAPMDFEAIRGLDPLAVNLYSERTRRAAAMIVERFGGKMVISQTDLGGAVDILASLRRTEQLLIDCVDSPEEIKRSSLVVEKAWRAHFRHYDGLFSAANAGWRSSWHPLLSKSPFYPSQCDFCYMISPAMFEELVLPSLTREAAFLGRVSYHLDGPGEVPHADMICSIPGVKIIQWTPGAGEADTWDEKWFPLYRRIIDRGKKILIWYPADPGKVRSLYSKFPAKEFCLIMSAPDEAQARDLEALKK